MADDDNRPSHVFGSKGAPRGILTDDGYFHTARGAGGLRADNAQAGLAPSRQGENISRAHPGQDASRLVARLALARSCPRFFCLTELVTQGEVLADVTVRARQVLDHRVSLRLQLGQPRRERNDGGIRLILRERRLQHSACLGAR